MCEPFRVGAGEPADHTVRLTFSDRVPDPPQNALRQGPLYRWYTGSARCTLQRYSAPGRTPQFTYAETRPGHTDLVFAESYRTGASAPGGAGVGGAVRHPGGCRDAGAAQRLYRHPPGGRHPVLRPQRHRKKHPGRPVAALWGRADRQWRPGPGPARHRDRQRRHVCRYLRHLPERHCAAAGRWCCCIRPRRAG